MSDEEKAQTVKVPTFTSCRYVLAYVGIVGVLCTYAIRINLSVAIVCMVKSPDVNTTKSWQLLNTTEEIGCDFNTEKATNATEKEYEFNWSRPLQGALLSSLFFGYILTQFPGGWLARRFGGKRVLGSGMLISAVSTILIPVAARTHVYIVIALRVLVGLGTGVVFPSFHHIWSTWAPPLERTKLIAFTYSGTMLGNVVTLFLSGYLCKYGFAGGWPSIFYVFGGGTMIWLIFWAFLVYDSPAVHPRISEAERLFIEHSTGRDEDEEGDDQIRIPWLSFVKSIPLWSICVTHIASNWGNYLLLTGLPTYMKDVLKFDMKENGLFSALPYIGMFFMANLVGEVADIIREKGVRTMVVRKVCQTLSFFLPGLFLIITSFLDCTQRPLAVALVVIAVSCTAFGRAGYIINHVDIAPRFAGLLFGITNTVGTIPGMLAPMTMGYIVTHGKREEWQTVFYICAGIFSIGALAFACFSKGEEQEWAKLHRQHPEASKEEIERLQRRSSAAGLRRNKSYVEMINN